MAAPRPWSRPPRPPLLEPTPLVHDQRLIAIVTTLNNLAEAHLREGKTDLAAAEIDDGDAPPIPPARPHRPDPPGAGPSGDAPPPWPGRSATPTYRSEMLYRVVDNMAYGSQTIVNEFPADAVSRPPTGAGRRARTRASPDQLLRRLGRDRPADRAAGLARPRRWSRSPRPRPQSGQFARGLEVARMIPQPEVRTDALVRIAEAQARTRQTARPGRRRPDLSRGGRGRRLDPARRSPRRPGRRPDRQPDLRRPVRGRPRHRSSSTPTSPDG